MFLYIGSIFFYVYAFIQCSDKKTKKEKVCWYISIVLAALNFYFVVTKSISKSLWINLLLCIIPVGYALLFLLFEFDSGPSKTNEIGQDAPVEKRKRRSIKSFYKERYTDDERGFKKVNTPDMQPDYQGDPTQPFTGVSGQPSQNGTPVYQGYYSPAQNGAPVNQGYYPPVQNGAPINQSYYPPAQNGAPINNGYYPPTENRTQGNGFGQNSDADYSAQQQSEPEESQASLIYKNATVVGYGECDVEEDENGTLKITMKKGNHKYYFYGDRRNIKAYRCEGMKKPINY